MGFHTSPDIELPFHRPGWDKSIFWYAITGLNEHKGNKVRYIQVPPLRILHRILASTIFAKGETCTHATDLELQLLDMMLQAHPPKPDLALLMAMHWIDVRDNPRSGGSITMGSYVTQIAEAMEIDISQFEDDTQICPGPKRITVQYLDSAKFLKIKQPGVYEWQLEDLPNFLLPYEPGIDKTDMSTWRVPDEYLDYSHHPRPTPQAPPSSTAGASSNNPFAAGPSNTSHPPYYPPPQWFMEVTQSLERLNNLALQNQGDNRPHRQDDEQVGDEPPRRHRRHGSRHR